MSLSAFVSCNSELRPSGDEHFSQAVTYMKNHELYNVAIEAYSSDPEKLKVIDASLSLRDRTSKPDLSCILQVILDAKGDWLILESEPAEAALGKRFSFSFAMEPMLTFIGNVLPVFMMAGQRRKAVNAYMRANLWQEAFAVALALPMADDELLELADQVAGRLSFVRT